MADGEEDLYSCPSFNSYSSNGLAEIAIKVAMEDNADNDGDEDFEFSLVREDKDFSEQKFAYDGQFGPIFPVFNRDLLSDGAEFGGSSENKRLEMGINVPLSKLLFEDREDHDGDAPQSCTSSEADELENIPVGTYSVWRPKAADPPSPSGCRKSNSTGSASKQWKFRDLLRRSNSEGIGKDSFVFLTPKNREDRFTTDVPKKRKGKEAGGSGSGAAPVTRSAHEELYVRNRTIKEEDKKKTYLPYRQGLVGFFVNVNVLPRF